MDNLTKTASLVLPLVAIGLATLVIGINLYLKVRRKFPATVNCWFCNSWVKVAYDERHRFDCPACLQYNGFSQDGGYDKIIPAQHDELLNRNRAAIAAGGSNYGTAFAATTVTSTTNNGLCLLCNNNQQLKIFQLANFVPLNENNYDVEIEHFQKQLDKAYKLCRKCDIVLSATLTKQQSKLFDGTQQIKTLGQKGLDLLDLNRSSGRINRSLKRLIFMQFIKYTLILFAALILFNNLFIIINNLNDTKVYHYFAKYYVKYVPDVVRSYLLLVHKDAIAIAKDLLVQHNHHPLLVNIVPQNLDRAKCLGLLTVAGVIFQTIQIFVVGSNCMTATIKVNHFLCWVILALSSLVRLNQKYTRYIYFLHVFCSIYVMYGLLVVGGEQKNPQTSPNSKLKTKLRGKRKKTSVRKFVRNLECTVSDLSDDDDISCDAVPSSSPTIPPVQSCATAADNDKDIPLLPTPEQINGDFDITTSNPAVLLQPNRNNGLLIGDDDSFKSSLLFDTDLHKSLDNLHLGHHHHRQQLNINCSSTRSFSPIVPLLSPPHRPRPLLSPSKFKTSTQNSWVAGGFWRQSNDLVFHQVNNNPQQETNLSRSSSQSSGFESQTAHGDYAWLPPPPRNNTIFGGDFDKCSMMSEPAYHIGCGLSQRPTPQGFCDMSLPRPLYYRHQYHQQFNGGGDNNKNCFYPILNDKSWFVMKSPLGGSDFMPSYCNSSSDGRFSVPKSMFLGDDSFPPIMKGGSSLFKFDQQELNSSSDFRSNNKRHY